MAKIMIAGSHSCFMEKLIQELVKKGHSVKHTESQYEGLELYNENRKNPFEILIIEPDIPWKKGDQIFTKGRGIELKNDIKKHRFCEEGKTVKRRLFFLRRKVYTRFILLEPPSSSETYERKLFDVDVKKEIGSINKINEIIIKEEKKYWKERYEMMKQHFFISSPTFLIILCILFFQKRGAFLSILLFCFSFLAIIIFFLDYVQIISPENISHGRYSENE